jgi:GxxExxY protein
MENLTRDILKELTYQVNGAAIEVHKFLGPGLLESVYHQCLCHELSLRHINYKSQMMVPLIYKGLKLETLLRYDIFVEDCLVVEVKAQKEILPVHEAQILTYMNILQVPKGVIYNFFSYNLYRDGQKTFVNHHFEFLD